MHWDETFKSIRPYIVKIESPDGHGTGFMFAANKTGTLIAVATAMHVVSKADEWQKPLRITHDESGKSIFLKDGDRAIFTYAKRDAAAIIFSVGDLPFPKVPLAMIDKAKYMPIGTELAWVGYPAMCSNTLCLFQGAVSAFLGADDSYLIDGVAINGVSGGPVFVSAGKEAGVIGIVSAYWPNRNYNEVLPGLLMAHDVTDLYEVVEKLKSLDDAKEQAATEKAAEPTTPSISKEPPMSNPPIPGS